MLFVEITILLLYACGLLFVFLYSMEQFGLAIAYRKKRNNHHTARLKDTNAFLPKVTVQLPVYNEKYVIKRLLKYVCSLEYPGQLLQIQILDDSTDETSEIIKKEIKKYPNVTIEYIHRKNRQGYKAGALKNGLKTATGELIAIFDADFMPHAGFLKQTIPYFQDNKTGMVQTRWGHRNKNFSLLTKLQAFGLDAHFKVEQPARMYSGAFINFNGTAGIWRKKCIEDAGSWQSDTLTEDLDLSYRAQLKGWKFLYLSHIETPAELPVTVQALKNQQFRWTKGAAECAKKHLLTVLKDKTIPFTVKKHAFFHLLNSSVYLFILYVAFFSVPVFFIKIKHPEWDAAINIAGISLLSFVFFGFFYWLAEENKTSFWWKYPLFLSITMGLLVHNALAVIEAFVNKKTPFVRTPKFNLEENGNWENNHYIQFTPAIPFVLEWGLFFYSAYGILLSFQYDNYGFLPFWAMLCFGTGYLNVQSIRQWLTVNTVTLKNRKLKPKTIV